MPDREPRTAPSISQGLIRSRLAQSEQMRDFFLQMWAQNPVLAKRAGKRIQDLLCPLARRPASTDF